MALIDGPRMTPEQREEFRPRLERIHALLQVVGDGIETLDCPTEQKLELMRKVLDAKSSVYDLAGEPGLNGFTS